MGKLTLLSFLTISIDVLLSRLLKLLIREQALARVAEAVIDDTSHLRSLPESHLSTSALTPILLRCAYCTILANPQLL